MGKLVGIVDFIQSTVEKGATSVEGVHRSLAAKPFEVVRMVKPLDEMVFSVQKIQDQCIGSFYDLERALTHSVGETAKVIATRIEGGAEQQDKERIWK